jgi:hypothetical protein
VGRRLTDKQVQLIVRDIEAEVPLTFICEQHNVARNTIIKIHNHICTVGHYGRLTFGKSLPPLRPIPGRRTSARHATTKRILEALATVEEATPAMVYEILRERDVKISRSSLQNTLLKLARERKINRRPRWYSLIRDQQECS